MGDPQDPRATSFSLPPGCRFYPSHQQLVCHYLTNKNSNGNSNPRIDDSVNGYDLIRELELYNYEPFELPDTACFSYGCGGRKRHWYCYTVRVAKERKGRKRKTMNGYWRRRGTVRDVVGSRGKAVVGTRTSFVFYLGNSPKTAVRTDWVMYEYALLDNLKASFVLCRVFAKSHAGNSISDNGLSCCAEESVPAVRHIGIQHDGYLTPDTVEAAMYDDNSVDRNSEIPKYPKPLVSELDNPIMTGPVCVPSFPFPSGLQPREPVSSSALPGSDAVIFEALTDQQLLSILEDDFIELDDLMR
ncbi:NAC transcription factor 29-like [Corylus avellana]|uniref:NAC transcription factor 29-like n=1 Tax=Corylus avellana TaxID=13451 RepID=UPI00286AAD52|nr:NAC transcription factor 29-like [Corylus avellana]